MWAERPFLSLLMMMSVLPVPVNVLPDHQATLELPAGGHSRSNLPVANSTRSFWLQAPEVTPCPNEGSTGPLTADADICIIGSGITGISAAYHLAKAFSENDALEHPIKAVVLEAREFCSGATGRNGGHLTPGVFADFRRHQQAFGTQDALRGIVLEQRTARELLKIIKENNMEDYVDLVAGGHVDLLFTEQEVEDAKADFRAAKDAGVNMDPVEWLSTEEVEKQYGAPYSGVRIPGHNLWPLKLVSLLFSLAANVATASSKFSLDLHTCTPVTAISKIQDSFKSPARPRRWSLTTPRGDISCSYVLHATNGYASHLLPYLHGPEGVIPTRGQIIATRAAVNAEKLTKSSFSGNEGFEYWFPRPVRSDQDKENPLVILGGGREVALPKYELYQPDDSVVNEEVGQALRKFLPSVFPGKYELGREPDMEWTGIMGFTKSGDPFVGPVFDPSQSTDDPYEGQYISAGYSGHGMPRAFSCAQAAADMIAADIIGTNWSIPAWLPGHYLTRAK